MFLFVFKRAVCIIFALYIFLNRMVVVLSDRFYSRSWRACFKCTYVFFELV